MGRDTRRVTISVLIKKPEHMPRMENGGYRYSDDVMEEFNEALEEFLDDWFKGPGHAYLDQAPITST